MAEEKQDTKWILVISLILFFVFEGAFFYVYYFPPQAYVLFNIWWYIHFINLFFIILTVIFSALNKVGFGDKELTYQVAVYSFVISMALIFVSSLRLLPFTL